MKLVVGLGNPGRKYDKTRHNIGFAILDHLAERLLAGPRKKQFDGETVQALHQSEKLLLLWPHTFMNLSGSSVQQAARFFKIENKDVLVVCDDFHLPLERLRIRPGGSAGGQKGLADILRCLGSQQIARLRYGVGPMPDRWNAADFVLGRFAKQEQEAVAFTTFRAADAILRWFEAGTATCMNEYNASNSTEENKKKE